MYVYIYKSRSTELNIKDRRNCFIKLTIDNTLDDIYGEIITNTKKHGNSNQSTQDKDSS